MTTWVPIFIVITACAVVLQAGVMVGMFIAIKRTTERVDAMTTDLHARVNPILTRVQILVEDAQPRITAVISDAAEISYLARNQAQKVDRVFTEALDRVRMQLAHVDQILTGALEAVEEAGTQVRRSVLGPMQTATAVIRGVQTGLEFLRSRRRHRGGGGSSAAGDLHDENLFI